MRRVAPSLWLAGWMFLAVFPAVEAAEVDSSLGKDPGWEMTLEAKPPDPAGGAAEETPNHRRRRLGEPAIASETLPDLGESLETPNQRRKRLATDEIASVR